MELHINNISKTYPNGVQALKDVTLTIPMGMYGLLGPNGSGKSTLMRTIATLQEPDEGRILLGGPSTGSGQVVAIQIYHHPEHDMNPERGVQSVQASLDYCTEQFGPYGRPYIRIMEYPGHGGADRGRQLAY